MSAARPGPGARVTPVDPMLPEYGGNLANIAGQTSHIDSMRDPFTDLEINTTAQLSQIDLDEGLKSTIEYFTSRRDRYW